MPATRTLLHVGIGVAVAILLIRYTGVLDGVAGLGK